MKIYNFIAISCILCINIQSVYSQQIFTVIHSDLPIVDERKAELESLFTISEMPKVVAQVSVTVDKNLNVQAANNLKVVKLFVTVQLHSLVGNKFLAQKDFSFSGSGNHESAAQQNAFSKMIRSSKSIRDFLMSTNNAADSPDCASIEKEIDYIINSGHDFEALFKSKQIDYFCKEYGLIYQTTFKKIQQRNCEKLLMNAKAYTANKNYEDAVYEIIKIQPDSDCYGKAHEVIHKISQSYELDDDKRFTAYKEAIADKEKYMEFFLSLLAESRN